MKKRYERWKVILGILLFLMVMGIVGHIECEGQDAPEPDYSFPPGQQIYVADRQVSQ